MSGLDEQAKYGIACPYCNYKGSFVYIDNNYDIDLHIRGVRIYISSRKGVGRNVFAGHPLGISPQTRREYISYFRGLVTKACGASKYVCKHCRNTLDRSDIERNDIINFIRRYLYIRMIYIGMHDSMSLLTQYEDGPFERVE